MSKKKSKTTTTVTRDPLEQELANIRLEQERRIDPLRAQSVGILKNLLEPGAAGATGTGGLAGSPFDEGTLAFATPEERASFGRLKDLTDVSGLEKAAARTLESIVGPELQAQLTAAGLGRSGAVGESLAKEGTRMALPIQAEARAASGNVANFLAGISQRRQGVAAGLADPNKIFFEPARTTTQTSKSSGSWTDWLAPAIGLAAAPFTGGASLLGTVARGIGGLLGSGSGGGAPTSQDWRYQPSPYGILSSGPFRPSYSLR